MTFIINAGSENKGGIFEQALKNAQEWLKNINAEYPEVEMSVHENRHKDGHWQFNFTHKVTGKTILLDIHGFTKEESMKFVFHPRVYWNGSSTANPEKEDWITEGFTYRIVYERIK